VLRDRADYAVLPNVAPIKLQVALYR